MYSHKQTHELVKALTEFLAVFEEKTGMKANPIDLAKEFILAAEAKEMTMLSQTFGTFTPKNLRECAKIMEELAKEPEKVESTKKKKANTIQ